MFYEKNYIFPIAFRTLPQKTFNSRGNDPMRLLKSQKYQKETSGHQVYWKNPNDSAIMEQKTTEDGCPPSPINKVKLARLLPVAKIGVDFFIAMSLFLITPKKTIWKQIHFISR